AMARTSITAEASLPLPLRWPAMAAFALSMMLYVGCEGALGGWLPSFAIRNSAASDGASIALWYWVAELAGRLLLVALAPRLAQATVYRVLLSLLLVAQVALLSAVHAGGGLMAAIAVIDGLCLGPLY